jgi:hypothetical protein
MITADQLVLHAIGDYILQSDRMAQNKTKSHLWAFIHALSYSLLFVMQVRSLAAWLVIFGSHFLIDRYRLARYVVYLKNWPTYIDAFDPADGKTRRVQLAWADCSQTGYPHERPAWLSTWLLIIADNILHVLINGLAIAYLR